MRAVRANLLPGLVLQLVALALVLAYCWHAPNQRIVAHLHPADAVAAAAAKRSALLFHAAPRPPRPPHQAVEPGRFGAQPGLRSLKCRAGSPNPAFHRECGGMSNCRPWRGSVRQCRPTTFQSRRIIRGIGSTAHRGAVLPFRQAQGPESLDRLGTLSLSKRPVEGLRPFRSRSPIQGATRLRPYVDSPGSAV